MVIFCLTSTLAIFVTNIILHQPKKQKIFSCSSKAKSTYHFQSENSKCLIAPYSILGAKSRDLFRFPANLPVSIKFPYRFFPAHYGHGGHAFVTSLKDTSSIGLLGFIRSLEKWKSSKNHTFAFQLISGACKNRIFLLILMTANPMLFFFLQKMFR